MQASVDGLNLLTIERANAHMDSHLRDQRYITSAELRKLVYAPADEVRADLLAIVQRENQLVAELKNETQLLFNQTRDLQIGFEQSAASATANVESIQAQLMASFEQRNTQLQEHIDTAQRNNLASLELLKVQLGEFSATKQIEIMAHCEGRLQALYDKVISDARAHFGESRSSAEGGDASFGNGAPRERVLFDARDYKIPELTSDPSLAVFKKWKHDVELFIETIGPSWKGVPRILRTSRHLNTEFIEGMIPEMRTFKTKREPDAPDLEYGFDFFGKSDALYKLLMPAFIPLWALSFDKWV